MGAFKRLFSCMDSNVNFQIRSVFKSFTATRMRALMHLSALLYPPMIAELTSVLLDLFHVNRLATEGSGLSNIFLICQ